MVTELFAIEESVASVYRKMGRGRNVPVDQNQKKPKIRDDKEENKHSIRKKGKEIPLHGFSLRRYSVTRSATQHNLLKIEIVNVPAPRRVKGF